MLKPTIFYLYAEESLANSLQKIFEAEKGSLVLREFPDQETYLKFESNLKNRPVIFLASLNQPNPKLAPLIFAAETARTLGAKKITLIAPYLAYMRQDKQFHEGEGVTSKYFAKIISQVFDEVITIDPHLHRYHNLGEIYSIPTKVFHATRPISTWIQQNVTQALIIGPDEESKQWAEEIARPLNAPCVILKKIRHGDREVSVSLPDISAYKKHTPVLIDDIISTAKTMIATLKALQALSMKPAICIGVHAVFADKAYEELLAIKPAKIVTCNTIAHPTNEINVAEVFKNDIPA